MSNKSNYAWYKEHNICPGCCRMKPTETHVYCDDCLKKRKEKQSTKDYRDIKHICYVRLREERKTKNLCVRCGKPKFNDKKQHCDECLVKFRKYNKASIERKKNDAE